MESETQELLPEEAVALLKGRRKLNEPQELSPQDATSYLKGIRREKPSGLGQAFASSALEAASAVPGLLNIASEKVGELTGTEPGGLFGVVEEKIVGAGEAIDPVAGRGQGGLPEDLARGAGSIAGSVPAMMAGPAAAAVQFGAQSGVPLYYDIKASTGDEEAAMWGLLFGGATGQLEKFGAERALGSIVKKLSGKGVAEAVTSLALRAALTSGQEAGTEALQTAAEGVILEALTPEDVAIWENVKRALPPALILGGAFGAVDGAIQRGKQQQPAPGPSSSADPADSSGFPAGTAGNVAGTVPDVPGTPPASAPQPTDVAPATPAPTGKTVAQVSEEARADVPARTQTAVQGTTALQRVEPRPQTDEQTQAANEVSDVVGGMVEELLSGSAILTTGEQSRVRSAWSLLSRAIGAHTSMAQYMEAAPKHDKAQLAEAMRTVRDVYERRVTRREIPEVDDVEVDEDIADVEYEEVDRPRIALGEASPLEAPTAQAGPASPIEAPAQPGEAEAIAALEGRRKSHPTGALKGDIPTTKTTEDLGGRTDKLYRETSPFAAEELIRGSERGYELYWTNDARHAVGNGGNRGWIVEVDPKGIKGRVALGKDELARQRWKEGSAEFKTEGLFKEIAPNVRSVTQLPGYEATPELEKALASWTREELEDGSVRYTKPGEAAALPQPEDMDPEQLAPDQPPAADAEPAKATGIKNKVVERELEEMGLPLPEKEKRKGFVALHAKAKETFEADRDSGSRLVTELEASPRPTTDEESALLTFEANRLITEREAAEEAFLKDPSEANQARIDEAKRAYGRAADVLDKVGTQTGRALAARKLMMARDYSLAAMERAFEVAKGGEPLTAKETARVKELHEKLAATTKAHEQYVSAAELKRAELEAENAMLRLQKEAKGAGRRSKRKAEIEQTKKELDDILNEIARVGAEARTGLDPKMVALTAKAAAKLVKLGTKSFAQFADQMVARFGESIRPYLQGAWDAGSVERRREQTGKLAQAESPEEVSRAVQKIALEVVESGVKDRTALAKAVHEIIRDVKPEMTLEDTRDAISGYGIYRPLAQGEARRTLRDLKGQMQQVAKLEALQARQPIQKTGFERQEPSPTQKRMAKQVKQLQRFLGLKPVDPAKAKTQALAAVKARLRSQINSLEEQIDSGQKSGPKGTIVKDDDVRTLEAYRDDLKRQYEALFPKEKRQLTDEQKIAIAIKATEKSLKDIEARLAARDLTPRVRVGPTSPKLEALRAERDARRAELEWLRMVNEPKKSPEEIALKAYKTRKANEAARLLQRITFRDFAPDAPKAPVTLDDEAIKLKAAKEDAARLYEKEKAEFDRANRTRLQKAKDAALEVARFPRAILSALDVSAPGRQGIFFALGHPIISTKQAWQMLRALRSESVAAEIDAKIKEQSEFARASGLDLAPLEEDMVSRYAQKVPGVRASNRAYSTFLNLQRIHHFNRLVAALPGNPTLADGKVIAKAVNILTGRGAPPKKIAGALDALGTVLWSPRLLISRFQTIAGSPLYRGSWAVKKEIAKDYARFLAGAGALYTLVQGYDELDDEDDVSVEYDWRSSDLGKIKIGTVRIDPLGGLSQVTVFVGRTIMGEKKSASGALYDIRGPQKYGKDDWSDVAKDFLRSKLSPVAAATYDILTGTQMERDANNEPLPTTAKSVAKNLITPISMREIEKDVEELGVPKTVALRLIGLFGLGVQNYESGSTKTAKKD